MDAAELGRRRAAEIHMAAIARGLDPTKPYAFAVREASHRGLDVEMANPGAAILDNGRATMLPEQNLIIHENTGSDFERAFLVAHEIGHHELGDGVSPTTTQVNMAQIAEPPAGGAVWTTARYRQATSGTL